MIFFPGDQVSQGCSGGSSFVVFLFLESGKMINVVFRDGFCFVSDGFLLNICIDVEVWSYGRNVRLRFTINLSL